MMPKQHLFISFVIGSAGWCWSESWVALPVALFTGVAPDVDHLVDYIWYAQTGEHRLLLPFHAYELTLSLIVLIGWLFGKRVGLVGAVAYLAHLLGDQKENRVKPGAYLLLWRVMKGFRIESLSYDPVAGKQGRIDDMVSLARLFNRAFDGRNSTSRSTG